MTDKHYPDLSEDFDDFFESSLCGFVITDGSGKITRMNQCAANWLHGTPDHYTGKRFSDILSIGSKIYFETHLWPMLRVQGKFDEVSVELTDTGKGKLPVYVNGYERKDQNNKPVFMRFTLFKATDRRLYEENLKMSKKLMETNLKSEQEQALIREQFIAVLGHDLRNPLGAVMSAAQLLNRSELSDRDKKLMNIIQSSSKRMYEMISNIMDLARGRLGGGISINPVMVDLSLLLDEVSNELKVSFPDRTIESHFNIKNQVKCDPGRISQLVSNLLANAITHGFSDSPIILNADATDEFWQISVINGGQKIEQEAIKNIFNPFHRVGTESNQNGLGLGLYIASEISKAHNGDLSVTSDDDKTCFSLRVRS
ncbi:PAS/PAC sensor signal transduction histidine kinase [Chryseobacterium soldanellicola]|uniref:histidine kinase n=1 Tax=Chryseobacterium soldanellicola TaxID=311333 RepID=A0A1H1FAQ9_9FLAO|nr:PAS domain-containing sensor histidine kinase [Chryseobacterium soldanellicola]SDQ97928.1 PAS/PAC sensor signal transduction histidine kinase [Chryseobacterium soldanellicola]